MNTKTSQLSTDSYYPLFLNIAGRLCVVVGGGRIAERKVKSLLQCRATVRVISPRVTKAINLLYHAQKIELEAREFLPGDTIGATLVFAATNRRNINDLVSLEAKACGIFVNVVDEPDLCEFIVPSIIRSGPVTIAISTSGTAPLASKKIRKHLETLVRGDFARYVLIVGKVRRTLKTRVPLLKERRRLLDILAGMEVNEVNGLGAARVLARLLGKNP